MGRFVPGPRRSLSGCFVTFSRDRAGATVLLAEDEPGLRQGIEEALLTHGYTVLSAPEGQAALALAEAHEGPIHLLVTDMAMPGMSGRELAEQLFTRSETLKILYISGYVTDEDVGTRLGWQGAAFLRKPFTIDALLTQVRALLG
jgi:two-component system cell cycle sensor histidine kinase/response regulator CckA